MKKITITKDELKRNELLFMIEKAKLFFNSNKQKLKTILIVFIILIPTSLFINNNIQKKNEKMNNDYTKEFYEYISAISNQCQIMIA